MEATYQFVLEILRLYGFYGLSFILLCGVVWYQERKHSKDRAEYRADFNEQHAIHRKDRNEWVDTLRYQNDKVLEAFKENTTALRENAVASKELSVHIQNCRLRN